MRKLVVLLMVMLLAVVGCKKNQETQGVSSDNTIIIGIAKIIAHPALDAIEKGVIDEFAAQGYDNVTFDLQSANGEMSTAASIASKFKQEKATMVLGIATAMAQTLANSMKDTPVFFSAVTDPISAGLRTNATQENTNITGVSDMTPVKEQIELIAKFVPLKKLGFIYNSGENNSIDLLKITQKVCDDMGVELITNTVTNTSEVKQASEVVSPNVDAIYVSTDNVVSASLMSVTASAAKYKVPVVFAAPTGSEGQGVLVSYGVDYYKAGRETGKMMIRVLNGEKPGDIPVKYMTSAEELSMYIDENVAKNLGITIPADLVGK
ncbi:MAG: ABC transporter substrate-binding protein [Deferribacteraceae bacterium]|jgi:putative ABC transport system substrate-binding protein|nr:ABC transporter substrate-binding protein [Deferribacteraceae bacterium]